MAVIRNTETLDNPVSYIATLAFFSCVSCVVLMFKFGFKASLNFYNGNRRKSHKELDNIGSMASVTGAYRTNRDEFYGYTYSDTQRKSSQLNLPVTSTDKPTTPLRQVKSTSDLIKNKNLPPNLLEENPGISENPRGAAHESRNNKTQEKDKNKEKKLDAQRRVEKQRLEEQKKLEKKRLQEQKKLEKQMIAEQQKRGKQALKEQARQDKLRREREKKEDKQAKKDKQKKKAAPQPPVANPLGQANASTSANPLAQGSGQVQHSTNTLDSSISKSSGPPPYSAELNPEEDKDSSGNVTYKKPEDTGSWDMISKHRQNINRPANVGTTKQVKQTVMDLNYKVDDGNENRENSEA